MNDSELDAELQSTARRVKDLCRDVDARPHRQAQLRQELLRRHRDLAARGMRGASASPWSRFARVRRASVLSTVALAAAVAVSGLVWALQVSGHSRSQSAEAARLTSALARTAPTVTSWQMTLHRVRGDTAFANRCDTLPLGPGQRLYVRGNDFLLYSKGTWHVVTPLASGGECPTDWQWAFAQLPGRLADHHSYSILAEKWIDGQPTEGVHYTLTRRNGDLVLATAWVNERTGLIARLERTVVRGATVVEYDRADYRYDTLQ